MNDQNLVLPDPTIEVVWRYSLRGSDAPVVESYGSARYRVEDVTISSTHDTEDGSEFVTVRLFGRKLLRSGKDDPRANPTTIYNHEFEAACEAVWRQQRES